MAIEHVDPVAQNRNFVYFKNIFKTRTSTLYKRIIWSETIVNVISIVPLWVKITIYCLINAKKVQK